MRTTAPNNPGLFHHRGRPYAALLFGALLAGPAPAQIANPTPVGIWTTIDDHTHKPRSLVEIGEHDGVVSGRIVKLFQDPGEDPDPVCRECAGARHDQRVLGMTILWDLRRDGDHWNGGEILDPEDGSVYRVILHPSADGAHLEVRGYIGLSLLGRTQVWERTSEQRPAD